VVITSHITEPRSDGAHPYMSQPNISLIATREARGLTLKGWIYNVLYRCRRLAPPPYSGAEIFIGWLYTLVIATNQARTSPNSTTCIVHQKETSPTATSNRSMYHTILIERIASRGLLYSPNYCMFCIRHSEFIPSSSRLLQLRLTGELSMLTR
jgi:hypothetical protein